MRRQVRTRSELIDLLADQRSALEASCRGYDRGEKWEAGRLATAVYNLVHDHNSIRSILSQLDVRGSMRFVSTGREVPPPNFQVVFATPALLGMSNRSGELEFVPRSSLDLPRPKDKLLQFENWWTKEDIFDTPGVTMSRRALVFTLRNEDGGSHVGDVTNPAYLRLKAGAGVSTQTASGASKALQGVFPTMRQVAWEVSQTLDMLGPIEA
jgi:hypothetical protein